MALLCGHTASIVALVTCGLDEMKRTGGEAAHVSMTNRDFCEPSSCEVIVSGCSDGWLCAWDCMTRRCRRRRKLPQWLGSLNSMTSLSGTKRYVAVACDGCDSRITTTDEVDTNMKNLVDNARIAWERFGSTHKNSKITIVIVDTSVLGVVQVVCSDLCGIGPVRAIAAVPEADIFHKIMIIDHAGHIPKWKVSLKVKGMEGTAAGEEDRHLTALPIQDKTETVEDAKTVCFSPDGSIVLLVFGAKWVTVLTEDQSVVHQFLKEESKHGNADWAGGLFFPASGFPGWILLIWDVHGGATVFSLQTSETLAAEEVCWIPPFQTDFKLFFCFEYQPVLNSILCVASGHISFPMPNVWVRSWLLSRSIKPFSGLPPADHMANDASVKQVSCMLYACGNLRTPWETLASSPSNSGESVCKKGMHLHEESKSLSFGTEWVTASMVLFDKVAIPSALVLGYSSGVIKLIGFRTSLQEGEGGLLVEKSTVQDLQKHIGPVTCLAEHNTLITRGAQKYLLSGGMDSLTCIWNLNNRCQLLMTLHHHVYPVRQILLPPSSTYSPWSNCFVTVGEDGCIALISLETLQVERMFVGHPTQPKQITWDGIRGYLSCLCSINSTLFNDSDVLFVWDMKSGALERIVRGAAAHSMYTNFAQQLQRSTHTHGLSQIQNSSTSSLLHGEVDFALAQSADKPQTFGLNLRRKTESDNILVLNSKQSTDEKIIKHETSSSRVIGGLEKLSSRLSQVLNQGAKVALSEAKDNSSEISRESSSRNLFHKQPPIKGASPIAGVIALQFDLFTLMAPDLGRMRKNERESEHSKVQGGNKATGHSRNEDTILLDESLVPKSSKLELASSLGSPEGCLLRSGLAFLHLWGADKELDKCLQEEWQIMEPSSVHTAAGFAGDKGATTLLLPGWESTLEV
ncbi:hypothetical protein L7F22_062480 [Adiantum nelumboides]|nr:hypothetical protein [Adiantum nelumboides]